jgi:CDP-glucose 4,6-dehydratase
MFYGFRNEILLSLLRLVELGLVGKMKHLPMFVTDVLLKNNPRDRASFCVSIWRAQPIVSLHYSEPIDTISTNVMGEAAHEKRTKTPDNFLVTV